MENTIFNNIVKFDDYKVSYIGIPKAANSSIKKWLLPLINIDEANVGANIHDRSVVSFDYTNNRQLFVKHKDFFVFTITRNPWDRLVSTYNDKVKREEVHLPFQKLGFTNDMSFSQFVNRCCEIPDSEADVHFRSQYSMLTWHGRFLPNLIVKLDDLSNHNKAISSLLEGYTGLDLGPIPWENKKAHADYKSYYDESILEKFKNRYKKDVTFLGYNF